MTLFGAKGYLTPDDVPDDSHCRTFKIPNDVQWLSVFMGALLALTYPEAWQEYGMLSPDEAADEMLDIIWQAYADDDGICPTIPTPFWDTVTDIDDQEPEGEIQPWYGQIVAVEGFTTESLTFVENAFIWVVAGFIAYAGLPGAAIAFVPVAQRFVLAFKQHDLGGIVKVLIDFLEVAEIDTYGVGEQIRNLNIVMPDDGDPHTLYVMMSEDVNPAVTGDPFIQVVRKELAPGQVTPTSLRWDADTNTVQQTPDGGTTWVDNDSADPRRGSGFRLPARTSSDPRCDAAENMLEKLQSITNIFEAEISQLQAANAFLDIVLVFLPEVGIILEALLAATEFILTIGADIIASAFTDDQWNIVKCILYCDIGSDGRVTNDEYNQIILDIHTQCSTVVYDVLYTIMHYALNEVGLSNAGATGDAVGDCSGCSCPGFHFFDFTASDGGWSAIAPDYTTYIEGEGWRSTTGTGVFATIIKSFTADHITDIRVKGFVTRARGAAGLRGFWPNDSGSGGETAIPGWDDAFGDFDVEWSGDDSTASGLTIGCGVATGDSDNYVLLRSACIVTIGSTTLDGDPECL